MVNRLFQIINWVLGKFVRKTSCCIVDDDLLSKQEKEIKEKMEKPRLLIKADGMPKKQLEEIQKQIDEDPENYIWIFDRPVETVVTSKNKFDEYSDNIDAHIEVGEPYGGRIINKPSEFSYSNSPEVKTYCVTCKQKYYSSKGHVCNA